MPDRLDTIAAKLIETCVSYAEANHFNISVAVLDHSFTIIGARRMDQAYPHSLDLAIAKAHTALDYRAPTSEVAARLPAESKVTLSLVDRRLLFIAGGVPLRIGGALVGSVGVSGGLPQQDEDCAIQAVAAALQNATADAGSETNR